MAKKIRNGRYWSVYSPDHPNAQSNNGYILEHRLIMSQKIGRPLKKGEVVHHINKNCLDNRASNLELISSHSKHITEHNKLHGRWAKKFDKCIVCSTTKIRHFIRGLCKKCHSHWYHYNVRHSKRKHNCTICSHIY